MEVDVELQALRYFVEVARQGGFTRASRTLHVTQPAISKMVKAFEEKLGTPLLLRERRSVKLTDAGRIVLERAQGVLDSLRVIEEEVVELSSLRRGRLRIGMPPIVSVAFFAPLLAEFHTAYPGIELALREEGSHQIEALIAAHELDVGAVVLPTDEKAFETLPFVHDELRVVLHPSHPLARSRGVTLRELASTPFVLYRPEFALHGHILDACRRSGFKPAVVSESSHWDFIVAMVAANIGLALLPMTICRQLDHRQVRSVRLSEPVIPWNAGLIWRRNRHLPPATRAWIDLVQRRLVSAGTPSGGEARARSPSRS
ncbi:MAG TPA: LysR substrate-binding domain-containing protein [Anaeromyxobacteraceae bacterium]